jgi:hypothetical protein
MPRVSPAAFLGSWGTMRTTRILAKQRKRSFIALLCPTIAVAAPMWRLFQRWPKDRPHSIYGMARNVVPDLIVEVVSPSDGAADLHERILEYFRAGVRLVWIFYPQTLSVMVQESPTKALGILHGDEIDGATVLPGFRAKISTFFPPPNLDPASKADD